MNNISKGEALISLVSEETTVYSGELMENQEFVSEAKRLIKDLDSVDLNKTSLEDILKGEFFKSLDTGINNGSAERLQNCFYTCGVK